MKNPFLNTQRVEKFRALLAQATDPVDIAQTQWQYASELVKSGHVQEAIMQFKKLEEYLKEGPVKSDSKTQSFLRISLAIAHLRAAGKQNQEFGYNLDSVLLPIRSSGVYRNQEASRAAMAVLTEQLTRFRSDLAARWLLNLAYMTVGEYPGKVPPQWLIEPKVFDSDYDVKRFADVAPALGLDIDGLAGSSITEDFDGDGGLDIMVSAWGLRDQLRYFRNNADGTFTERTQEAGYWVKAAA